MLKGIYHFLSRHKKKFVFASAVIGGIVVFGKYAKSRLSEWQEQEAIECLSQARRQHHFDSNQRTCNMSVLSMIPNLRTTLMSALNTESLTNELKSRPVNKIEIWEELKVLSLTRTIVSIYSSSMFVLMLRIQLNIIGGYMYLDTLSSKNGAVSPAEDFSLATPEIQQRYLETIHYLLDKGLTDLILTIKEAVRDTIALISLKEELSLLDVRRLFVEIRHKVENNSNNNDQESSSLRRFMLPVDDFEMQACQLNRSEIIHRKLLTETADLLESADCYAVLNKCIECGFERVLDKLSEFFIPSVSESISAHSVSQLNNVKLPMAKIVPIVNRIINIICSIQPNHFIQELLLMEKLKDLAANVYEAFSQDEPCLSKN